MLVEFRVKNFRSLRDEQHLSLVSSKDKSLESTNTVSTGHNAASSLLRSVVIYGANAGGKSNLVKALQAMRGMVLESALIQPGRNLATQGFQFCERLAVQPTEFEVTFILEGVRYQYGFSMTSQRITSEHLLVYKAFKPQRWFERYIDEGTGADVYEFGPGLKGSKSLWEGATRLNSLFLSMAVLLNSDALRPVFDWFANQLVIFNELAPINQQSLIDKLAEDGGREEICELLGAADISIADIELTSRKVPGHHYHLNLGVDKTELRSENTEYDEHQVKIRHVTAQGEAVFDLMDESSGTRNLLFLAAPVLNILKQGLTLIVDELDTSLHPLLVRELVRLFHHSDVNKNGAQLIFTTHDTSLLDAPDLFRRDQIWFVEKDKEQASSLIPLSEFSPRKNEALERGYLIGRYGGIPFFNRSLILVADGS